MLLNEFFYFDQKNNEFRDDYRYIHQNDVSVLKKSDLRKSRLTLKMLNEIRKASEASEIEKKIELGLVRKMYKAPPAEGAPPV